MMANFAIFVSRQERRPGPIGDLARDVSSDECAQGLDSINSLYAHIVGHDPCDGALWAFERAVDEWIRSTEHTA